MSIAPLTESTSADELAGRELEHERMIALLKESVELARADGDASREAESELLLATSYNMLRGVGEEQRRLVRLYAERAEAAFVRAGDEKGEFKALALLATLAAEDGNERPVQYIVHKLQRLDAPAAEWWRWYTAAIRSCSSRQSPGKKNQLVGVDW